LRSCCLNTDSLFTSIVQISRACRQAVQMEAAGWGILTLRWVVRFLHYHKMINFDYPRAAYHLLVASFVTINFGAILSIAV
jgi:hypothetical protein